MPSLYRQLTRNRALFPGLLFTASVLLLVWLVTPQQRVLAESAEHAVQAPEFTHSATGQWLNGPPMKLSALRGRVVLIDFWTFDCWNCYRSFPWLNDLQRRFADKKLTIIGVHSPEFKHERDRDKVAAKIKQFKLHHPVMLDNDFSYWRAMKNQYWPAFYLIDKHGRLRFSAAGEIHKGDRRAELIETQIERLLNES